jgi:branched-chain amino acid transport system substrate-binding protein
VQKQSAWKRWGFRRLSAAAAAVVAAIAVAACGSSSSSSAGGASAVASSSSKSPIVIADLEGPAATGDPDFTKGMLIAQNEINAAGGVDGRMVQVKIYKKGLTPDSQVSVYRQAGADSSVLAAWGAATGIGAMVAQSDRVGLPLIGVPGRIDYIQPPKKWYYSISADQAYPDSAISWGVTNKGIKKIAVLHYTETDYSNGIVQSIKDRCTKTTEFGPPLGCQIVSEQVGMLTDTTSQLIPLLNNMKNSGADAYYIETLNPNGAIAARQLGMFNKPVLSEQWLSVPAIATACGSACQDIVFSAQKCVAPALIQSSDPAKAYCNHYQGLFTKAYPGQPYALFSIYGYDAVKLVAGAADMLIKAGKPVTRENLVTQFDSLNGQIRTSHGAVVSNTANHRLTGKFQEAYFMYVIKTVNGKPTYELAPGSSPQGATP